MGRWKEFSDHSMGQLWLEYCEKKMEVERLQEVNEELTRVLRQALVALHSCGEDYVYDGEDEHRVDCYDYKLVDEAIAAIYKVQGNKDEDNQ